MFALERQKQIAAILEKEGAVWVSRLSTQLGVTEETIRRDLEKLEKQELLVRTHGGAVPIDESTYELSLETRKHTNVDIKEKLAQEAVKYIVPGDIIFLDASTTTFYMAKELKTMSNVTIITNSMRVVNELSSQENLKVIAIGGIMSSNQSFVGSLAETIVENNYFAGKMFFSSKGVDLDVGILEGNEQECGIKKKMIESCRLKYYLCDKSKIGRVGFIKLSHLDKIDYFLTEAELDTEWKEKFAEMKVDIIKIEAE
ncbi:MAG: DeoR/GlpR family DNA-binding transcription regulator [Bacillota bacterium]|nr:DeoR/GlpR family DNA-binding transcription regulator [Bacillota bacterium]